MICHVPYPTCVPGLCSHIMLNDLLKIAAVYLTWMCYFVASFVRICYQTFVTTETLDALLQTILDSIPLQPTVQICMLQKMPNGFRKNRSTVDHIVRFESYLREAFVRQSHTVAIFFDIEQAYDTTWKHGILHDLQNVHLKGHLPNSLKTSWVIENSLYGHSILFQTSTTRKQEFL